MKRKASALALLAALGGCATADRPGPAQMVSARPTAGIQGPYGEPVSAVAAKPTPSGVVQASATMPADKTKTDSKVVPAGYQVNHGKTQGLVSPPPGAVAAVGALPGIPTAGGGMNGAACARTSIRFTSPAGMQIAWFAPNAAGPSGFTATQVEVPGRFNFVQGGVYRLKLSNLPGRPAIDLYPTLQVMPANPRTVTFLAHSTVPIAFTEEDFEQVVAGNLVVKVVYLPDPQFQDLAVAGPDEVVSTRLEPGMDPIAEAARRGSVLAVVRMGNIDLEAPNTPSLLAPPSGAPFQGMPLQVPPGAVPPGMMPPGGPSTMPYSPGALPPGAVPPGAVPPGAVPPGVVPGNGAPLGSPPMTQLPNPAGTRMPTSGPTVSAEAMFGRTK